MIHIILFCSIFSLIASSYAPNFANQESAPNGVVGRPNPIIRQFASVNPATEIEYIKFVKNDLSQFFSRYSPWLPTRFLPENLLKSAEYI